MQRPNSTSRHQVGYTLLELAVVIVIIGVIAGLGVPRLIESVERSRAADAFDYLSSIRAAQERYQARYGAYATNVTDLDIRSTPPASFTVPATFVPSRTSSLRDSWSLTLTRTGYGAYTIAFTEKGFDASNSTIARPPASTDIYPIDN
jgi:prepilin-type N-terminal cleavage/methylation domain-containing protein